MDHVQDDDLVNEPDEERIYTPRERALREYFVKQYLIDYDEVGAAVRVGYVKKYAKETAAKLLAEPYVMRLIKLREVKGGYGDEVDENPEVLRKRIMGGLIREANYRGPGSSQAARVAALSRLAQISGLDKPKVEEPEDEMIEGVIVVPGMMTPEQWKIAAAKQQAELVSANAQTSAASTTSIE